MCRIINDIMYRRPKSCSKAVEPRRVLKHQRSVDCSSDRSLKMAPKRSNSLQNLNATCYKERKLVQKPVVKLAWTEEALMTTQNWDSGGDVSLLQNKCLRLKSASEESKRKSIDIFLARSFDQSVRTSTSNEVGTRSNTISKESLFEKTLRKDDSVSKNKNESLPNFDTTFVLRDFPECKRDVVVDPVEKNVRGPESCRSEKKVTFASEVFEKRKLSAETRRRQFRDSHSKSSKTGSSIRTDTGNSFNCPVVHSNSTFDSSGCQLPKRVSSASTSENLDVELGAGCLSPNQLKQLGQSDKLKQLSVKRKLKSCRSRSFHRSLDSSSMIQSVTTSYSFSRSLKSGQTEVVTMISLLTSTEDQDKEIGSDGRSVSNVKESESKCRSSQNPEEVQNSKVAVARPKPPKIQIKTGILKMKPLTNKTLQVKNQPEHQESQFCIDFQESLKSSTISTIEKLETVNTDDKFVKNQTNFFAPEQNCEGESRNEVSAKNIEKDNQTVDTVQSRKEKECWSSFRKMTNKGVFVSFDTILRGLLTPTEYRLRKNEMFSQE